MQQGEHTPPLPAVETVLALLVALGGFALSWWLFDPGITTHDALAVYDQAHAWDFGDWQPPILGILWIGLERILGPGPRAILLPSLAAYWLAFFLLFVGLRRRSALAAWLVLVVAVLPPTFALIGIIWRDVMFASIWLLAYALTYATMGLRGRRRAPFAVLSLALVILGFWLRPNSIFAAVPIIVFILGPRSWNFKRVLVFALPVVVLLQATTFVINTVWLHVRSDHVAHSIMVFDLTGISHFAGQNMFPIDRWTPAEELKLRTECYHPDYWDAVWWEPCKFAMREINRDEPEGTKLFGSERLGEAWLVAITQHPLAYLKHRLSYFSALMTWETMVLFDQQQSGQYRFWVIKSSTYSLFASAIRWMNHYTPLFRGATWLALAVVVLVVGAVRPRSPGRGAVLSLALSGLVFAVTYLPFGVAAEYRYVYWTALSALVGAVVALAERHRGLSNGRTES